MKIWLMDGKYYDVFFSSGMDFGEKKTSIFNDWNNHSHLDQAQNKSWKGGWISTKTPGQFHLFKSLFVSLSIWIRNKRVNKQL